MAKSFYHLQKKKEFASEELEKVISGIEQIAENIKDMNERLRTEGDIDA